MKLLHQSVFPTTRSTRKRRRNHPRPPAGVRFFRPVLERLEDRTLLDAVQWTAMSSGFWDVAANWFDTTTQTNRVPTATDDVTINQSGVTVTVRNGASAGTLTTASTATLAVTAGSLSIGSTATISGGIDLSGGTLSLEGAATLGGTSQWSGGTISGSGTLTNTGLVTLSNPSGVSDTILGTVINQGTMTETGAGGLDLEKTLTNQAGATFNLDVVTGFTSGHGTGVFNNAGTFRVAAGSGNTVTLSAGTFNLTGGTVEVDSGNLVLEGRGTSTGGQFTVAQGATVDLTGGGTVTFGGSYTGSGLGQVLLGSGTINAAGATFDFPAGMFQWTGGTIAGGSTGFTNTGVMTLSNAANTLDVSSGSFTNQGTVNDAGPGTFDIESTFNNPSGAVFSFQGAAGFTSAHGAGIFNNAGTFRAADGAGVTSTLGSFGNFNLTGGTIEVDSGTLALDCFLSVSGGSVTVAQGGTLDLTGGSSVIYSGTLTGSGAGQVVVGSGTLFAGTNGATLDFPQGMLQASDGTISGSSSAPLTIEGGLTLTNSSAGMVVLRTVINTGTLTITSTGSLQPAHGAELINAAGGLLELQPGAVVGGGVSFPGFLENQGLLQLKGGTGTASIVNSFSNTGTVEVDSGTLSLTSSVTQVSGSTLTAGTWEALNGSSITFSSGTSLTTNQANVVIGGNGGGIPALANLSSNAGSFTLTGGATFTTAGNLSNTGTLTVGPASTLNVHGTYTQGSVATLDVQLGGTPASGQFGQLVATGAATLNGTLQAELVGGYGPTAGDQFTVLTYPSESGTFSTFNLPSSPSFKFQAAVNPGNVVLSAQGTAPDLAVVSVTAPANATIGQTATFSYTVQNNGSATPIASWVDSVYLSATPTLDPAAVTLSDTTTGPLIDPVLVARVSHTGAVAANGMYSQTLKDVPVPALPPGSYYLVVVADSQTLVPDSDRTNNVGASSNQVAVDVPALTLGLPTSGTIALNQDLYYRVDVPAGQDVLLTAHFAAAGAAEFDARFLAEPDRSNFDYAAPDFTATTQQITLPGTQPGRYYVLLHGREGAGTGQAFDLTATAPPLTVLSVTPDHGGNQGVSTLTLHGLQLRASDSVSLVRAGGPPLQAQDVFAQDSQTIFARFDLTGAAPGLYDVVVTDSSGASATLPQAYTIQPGAPGRLHVTIAVPAFMRPGRQVPVVLTYTNTGDSDLFLPFLTVTVSNGGLLRYLPDSVVGYSPITLLAPPVVPGLEVLPAGAAGQVTLYYTDPGVLTAHDFAVYANTVDDPRFANQAIDWNAAGSALQPAGVDPVAWSAYMAAERQRYGDTYGTLFQFLTAQIREPNANTVQQQAFVEGQWLYLYPQQSERTGDVRGPGDGPADAGGPLPDSPVGNGFTPQQGGTGVEGQGIPNVHVLIIADTDYSLQRVQKRKLSDLPGTQNEADQFLKYFSNTVNVPGGAGASGTSGSGGTDVTVLPQDQMDPAHVEAAIANTLGNAGPNDKVVVINMSHGANAGGANSLTGGQVTQAAAIYNGGFMTADDFNTAFQNAPCPTVFIDDTCNSAALTQGINAQNVTSIASADTFQTAADGDNFGCHLVSALQRNPDLAAAEQIAAQEMFSNRFAHSSNITHELAASQGLPTPEQLQELRDTERGVDPFLAFYKNQGLSDSQAMSDAVFARAAYKQDHLQEPVVNQNGNPDITLSRPDSKKPVTDQVGDKQQQDPPTDTSRGIDVGSLDPNDIIGPAGFGASHFLAPDQALSYQIDFQNLPTATAPAQTVVVTEQLGPALDPGSFQLGDIQIGGRTVSVPPGRSSFQTRVDATATVGVFVDVTAGINLRNGLVTWTFTSIDPATLDVPTGNPLEGFLPPDTNPPLGEGIVTYTVKPKATDTTGTVINAQATVVFDTNAPINTKAIFNTIDAGAPTSSVQPLPATTTNPTFTVSWSGQDDPNGSGIATFDVYASDNGGPFTPFQQRTTATSATFTGQVGHTYGFFSVATDNVGNIQPTPTAAQASIQVVPALSSIPQIVALSSIHTSSNVFAIGSDQGLYRHDASGWHKISGSEKILSISTGVDDLGQSDVFAVTDTGALFKDDEHFGWFQMDGPGNALAVSGAEDNWAIVITPDGSLYSYNGLGNGQGQRFLMYGPSFARALSTVNDVHGQLVVFVLGTDLALYRFDDSGMAKISNQETLQSISAGLDDQGLADAWAATTAGALFKYDQHYGWFQTDGPGNGVEVSADADNWAIVLTPDGSVFSYNGLGNGQGLRYRITGPAFGTALASQNDSSGQIVIIAVTPSQDIFQIDDSGLSQLGGLKAV